MAGEVGSGAMSTAADENAATKDVLKSAGIDDVDIEAAIAAIRVQKDLPRPAYPTLPNLSAPSPISAKVAAVQAYIEKLSYNFTGVDYFDVRKHRAVNKILDTGRDVTRQALPIKCVEAVFVATYLTQGLKDLERVPLSFRSQVNGVTYKHIVLALKYNNKWGTVARLLEHVKRALSCGAVAHLTDRHIEHFHGPVQPRYAADVRINRWLDPPTILVSRAVREHGVAKLATGEGNAERLCLGHQVGHET